MIEVFARVARVGTTSVTFEHAAYLYERDDLMVTARQTVVLVDLAERKARRIPDWYRVRVRRFEGEDVEA